MKQCELCDRAARMYCEADQASLCWECDGKVHGANFLVARHSRSLLCRSCQAPTPWKASGSRLGHTVSVCERCSACSCVSGGEKMGNGCGGDRIGGSGEEEEVDGEESNGEDDDEEEESDDEEEEEEEGEGDNQVVPWSTEPDTTCRATTPPPIPSCSSSGESSSGRAANPLRCGFSKRAAETANSSSSQVRNILFL
ncbi:unnamed protein product [Spirodela intermedia]|uniref:B box-type domain-containing protein n=2 Tax=Spirodela intermedia TaxID=51605 RepID=A0A7I8JF63_SPIIN|nr:unnamed protein product [Spirodela intermedia]CAA6668784.1 unnamed protein product [Spirodela intermedia]CAA7405684.1 unnamed protein product [Spirodela intermedia]